MAALFQIGVRRKGFKEALGLLADTEQVFKAPLAGAVGPKVEKVVLRGGVDRQFAVGGDPPWTKAHAFGDRQPAPITLGGRGGTIARIWANSPIERGPREIRTRVSDPRALGHQRGASRSGS